MKKRNQSSTKLKRPHPQNPTGGSYAHFTERGMEVDLDRYFRTKIGRKSFKKVADSAFPKPKIKI